MPNYKQRQGVLTVIETHEATGIEADFTFTFDGDFDKYSEFILVIDAAVTAVAEIRAQVNGITGSTYYTEGRTINGGTEVLIDLGGEASYLLMPTTMLASVNR